MHQEPTALICLAENEPPIIQATIQQIGPQFHKISVSSLHDLSQLLQHYSNFILIAEAQWLINQKNRWLDLPQGNHFQNCYFIGLGESAFHLLEDRALQNGFA
ncbi:MAG: hypothetical protein ONB13_01040, partial [candidate division KSB1 bacterium]|nr:hypothetical protein [candidate division KSB1 bacterium]